MPFTTIIDNPKICQYIDGIILAIVTNSGVDKWPKIVPIKPKLHFFVQW